MIIVTGSPRTGTSLMMQTLRFMGIPVAGTAFHADFSNRHLNQKGYWELPIQHTINGVPHGRFRGMAVKLFGLQLSRTRPEYISRIIVCDRNKEEAVNSIEKLIASELWQLERYGVKRTRNDAERTYTANYEIIDSFLKTNPFIRNMCVYYNNIIDNPKAEIERIAVFVDSDKGVSEAIANVGR